MTKGPSAVQASLKAMDAARAKVTELDKTIEDVEARIASAAARDADMLQGADLDDLSSLTAEKAATASELAVLTGLRTSLDAQRKIAAETLRAAIRDNAEAEVSRDRARVIELFEQSAPHFKAIQKMMAEVGEIDRRFKNEMRMPTSDGPVAPTLRDFVRLGLKDAPLKTRLNDRRGVKTFEEAIEKGFGRFPLEVAIHDRAAAKMGSDWLLKKEDDVSAYIKGRVNHAHRENAKAKKAMTKADAEKLAKP